MPPKNLAFPKQHLGGANQSFGLQSIGEHGWWLVHTCSSKHEQIMNKMVSVIGMVIEDSLHVDVHESPYYAIIVDEATIVSVN